MHFLFSWQINTIESRSTNFKKSLYNTFTLVHFVLWLRNHAGNPVHNLQSFLFSIPVVVFRKYNSDCFFYDNTSERIKKDNHRTLGTYVNGFESWRTHGNVLTTFHSTFICCIYFPWYAYIMLEYIPVCIFGKWQCNLWLLLVLVCWWVWQCLLCSHVV